MTRGVEDDSQSQARPLEFFDIKSSRRAATDLQEPSHQIGPPNHLGCRTLGQNMSKRQLRSMCVFFDLGPIVMNLAVTATRLRKLFDSRTEMHTNESTECTVVFRP